MPERRTVLERILKPAKGGFSVEHANYVLSLGFTETDQKRCANLSRKAQQGRLSEKEQDEIDEYLRVNALLIALQSKARISLKRHGCLPETHEVVA